MLDSQQLVGQRIHFGRGRSLKIFWSWQSDTPGKTGRFFVRDCLVEAVKKIREDDEIVEPTEREARDGMHVDSDRQGVAGSPDLANLIFQKIDAAQVIVADVTPVSRIPSKKLADGSRTRAKRNMNPNVAIELGYALKSRGSEYVLMVLNEAYGRREHLPFDLAHKAGPLLYLLREGATKAEIDAATEAFVPQLVQALKPYVGRRPKADTPLVVEGVPPTQSRAVFFAPSDPLVEVQRVGEAESRRRYSAATGFYLRLIPQHAVKFTRADLIQRSNVQLLLPLSEEPADHERPNEHGRIAVDLNADDPREIDSLTQVFLNGEIWGVSRRFFTTIVGKAIIPSMAVETAYRGTLSNYVTYVRDALKIDPPYLVIAGAVGLKSYPFALKGRHGSSEIATFLTNEFEERTMLVDGEAVARNSFLLRFFNHMWDELGRVRPANYTPDGLDSRGQSAG